MRNTLLATTALAFVAAYEDAEGVTRYSFTSAVIMGQPMPPIMPLAVDFGSRGLPFFLRGDNDLGGLHR